MALLEKPGESSSSVLSNMAIPTEASSTAPQQCKRCGGLWPWAVFSNHESHRKHPLVDDICVRCQSPELEHWRWQILRKEQAKMVKLARKEYRRKLQRDVDTVKRAERQAGKEVITVVGPQRRNIGHDPPSAPQYAGLGTASSDAVPRNPLVLDFTPHDEGLEAPVLAQTALPGLAEPPLPPDIHDLMISDASVNRLMPAAFRAIPEPLRASLWLRMYYSPVSRRHTVPQIRVYDSYRTSFPPPTPGDPTSSSRQISGSDLIKLVPKCFPHSKLNAVGYVIEGLERRKTVEPSMISSMLQYLRSQGKLQQMPGSYPAGTAPALASTSTTIKSAGSGEDGVAPPGIATSSASSKPTPAIPTLDSANESQGSSSQTSQKGKKRPAPFPMMDEYLDMENRRASSAASSRNSTPNARTPFRLEPSYAVDDAGFPIGFGPGTGSSKKRIIDLSSKPSASNSKYGPRPSGGSSLNHSGKASPALAARPSTPQQATTPKRPDEVIEIIDDDEADGIPAQDRGIAASRENPSAGKEPPVSESDGDDPFLSLGDLTDLAGKSTDPEPEEGGRVSEDERAQGGKDAMDDNFADVSAPGQEQQGSTPPQTMSQDVDMDSEDEVGAALEEDGV